MAIILDKKRKQYYIQYYINNYDGSTTKVKIRNKNWTTDFGKKRLKLLEEEIVEEDKKKRIINYHGRVANSLDNVLNDYIKEKYLTNKEGTAYGQELFINKYIKPNFKIKQPIDKAISIISINKYKVSMQGVDLCPKMINFGYAILRAVIDYACSLDMFSFEMGGKIKLLLKPIKEAKKPKKELQFWTVEEYNKFINSFAEDEKKWKLLFEVTYWGALRIGELLGLKFKDINYSNKTISIKRQLDKHGHDATTKNSSSSNSVTLPTFLMDELKIYEEENCPNPDDYIFFIKHTSRTSIKRVMDAHIELAGVPHITKHGLRHSMASRMINQGVNILVVSKHLRHASTQQTLDTYSHLFPNINKDIIDKLV